MLNSRESRLGMSFALLIIVCTMMLILFKVTGETDLEWFVIILSPLGLGCFSMIVIAMMIICGKMITILLCSGDEENERK